MAKTTIRPTKKEEAMKQSKGPAATMAGDSKSRSTKVPARSNVAKNLQDLFEDGLKDIYWAEKELKKALPKMHKNATSTELKTAIEKHLDETMLHVERLEKCFTEIGVKPKAERCDAMAGLIQEGEGIMRETEAGAVRDAGIIAAAQKIEHYEIATYGTLAAFAKVLGHKEGLNLLLTTLEEEKKCDENLTALADTNLNAKAG